MSTVTIFILSTLIKQPIYTFYIHKISTGKIYKSTPPYQHNSGRRKKIPHKNAIHSQNTLSNLPKYSSPAYNTSLSRPNHDLPKSSDSISSSNLYSKYILLGINAYNTTVLLCYEIFLRNSCLRIRYTVECYRREQTKKNGVM